MKNSEWNNLRAKLHHDWLQNRFLTFLTSWKDCFNGSEDCKNERHDILEQLLKWKDRKKDFKKLIDNIEEALSPRQYVYEYPLNTMADEDKEWLGEVVHVLYCNRTDIKNKTTSLQSLLEEVDRYIDITAQVLKGEKKAGKSQGDKIILLVSEFSRSISELPHEIQL